jgi:hypothetical protein
MQVSHVQIKRSLVLAMGAVLALACTASADKGPAPAPARPAAPVAGKSPGTPTGPDSPDARGRAALKAQLAALANDEAFIATFAKQATVLTPLGSNEVHAPNAGVAAAIGFLHPHAELKGATFDHFTSGGNAQVAWFAAELHLTIAAHEPGGPAATEKHTVRAIELLDGAADWKVAVASFTNVAQAFTFGTSSIKDPTDAGPLANLLLSPDALAGALGDGAVVFGTDPGERGLGTADAKALLGKWKKLTITLDPKSKVHEVRTATYGYAMTNVRMVTRPGGEAYKLNAFVLALPGEGGAWSVVGASYGALF